MRHARAPLARQGLTRARRAGAHPSASQLLRYVETRMSFIAPNLTIIAGSVIAAKLMGIAGGLTALSKIPACNVKVPRRAHSRRPPAPLRRTHPLCAQVRGGMARNRCWARTRRRSRAFRPR